jgi:hypothetical protein
MFAAATTLACKFTAPVVISWRRWDKGVGGGAGTFVVLNDEGWVVTAAHVFNIAQQAEQDQPQILAVRDAIAALNANTTMTPGYRSREIQKEERKAKKDWVTSASYWWAQDNIVLRDLQMVPEADLAIGRLDPFPREFFASYPEIKNPAMGLDPGTSLCRLGFPFHQVQSTYDQATDKFTFTRRQLVFFPIEGILTRTVEMEMGGPSGKYNPRWFETSSPGLMGQSGGPVYDTRGRVWGIQSRTASMDLGFEAKVKVGGRDTVERQVINLGVAVHPQTLVDVLTDLGIKFAMSAD